MKAKYFVLIFAGIELFTGITGTGGGIAHFAHLGGMVFGLILILYWKRKHRLYTYE
jgi:membrane associated rhomboid family serine protease